MVKETVEISDEGLRLANELIAAMKEAQKDDTSISCAHDINIEQEIMTTWTCEDCNQADTSVAWSSRFEASLCMGCEDFALLAAKQEGLA